MSRALQTALRLAAAAAAVAGSFVALPAMAENSWTGSKLVVTGTGGPNCRLAITRAYGGSTLSGIRLTLRNGGSRTLDVSGDMKLAGNGLSKTGDFGFGRVPAGATVEHSSQLTTYGGDMSTTTLTVNIRSCIPLH